MENKKKAGLNMPKLMDIFFILMVTGFYSVIANMVGWHGELVSGSIGCLVLVALTMVGYLVSMVPGLRKLPVVFWVSLIAVCVSVPGFPGGAWVLEQTNHVSFLALTTPILAYGGLCLGKDLEAFRNLSWRIVPVALCVAAGSFLCATALAEVMLHLEGIF